MCKLLTSTDFRTSTWSGGTTTELLIYPPEANYVSRDFAWRLSTAKVEVAESTFTALPGYERVLMVLEGRMHLNHLGHHEALLLPFEQDRFMGDWQTKCYGTGKDFNLMLGRGWQGSLEALSLQSEDAYVLKPEASAFHCVYCVEGTTQIRVGDEHVVFKCGDLLISKNEQVAIGSDIAARVVLVKVSPF